MQNHVDKTISVCFKSFVNEVEKVLLFSFSFTFPLFLTNAPINVKCKQQKTFETCDIKFKTIIQGHSYLFIQNVCFMHL